MKILLQFRLECCVFLLIILLNMLNKHHRTACGTHGNCVKVKQILGLYL